PGRPRSPSPTAPTRSCCPPSFSATQPAGKRSASYLGWNRLRRALARLRAEGGEAEVVFHPFQIAPDAPSDPAQAEPLEEVHKRVFGPSVGESTARMTALAAREGTVYDYGKALFANTFEAHRLITVAAAQGRAETMVDRLFRAYFADGLNLADSDTLRKLVAEVGVAWTDGGVEETRAELEQVRMSGIRGVPIFKINGRTLSGAQSEETFYGEIS
ncbi:DsbA family protein, partial [Streptosporangium sp. NPDC000396]|uniref:DsbA family protein n=1 Tax=Streptosporangium sp. NPDC000396 TaxID=3366185 RepID=UPI003684C152